MNSDYAKFVRSIVITVVAAAVLAAGNWAAKIYLVSNELTEAPLQRPDRIRFIAHDPSSVPPPLAPPELLFLGNSHTYTLPGLHRGEGLRIGAMASRRIVLDELVDLVERANPKTLGSYYLLAYPNFLPYEMLTRVAQLYEHGYKPDLVVVGVTWRNIARDSQLRSQIRKAFDQQGFADAFLKSLKDPQVHASRAVLAAVDADARRVEADKARARDRSDADKLDGQLTDFVGKRLTLLGQSAGIRARLQLDVMDPLQNLVVDRQPKAYEYDMVKSDYRFNWECFQALLRLFDARGARVICYLAPERSDLPPLMDPADERRFNEQLQREAEVVGAVVVDARHVVPNEYWGWEYDSPDRSHFTEPGHQRLARFLFEQIEQRHLWPPDEATAAR